MANKKPRTKKPAELKPSDDMESIFVGLAAKKQQQQSSSDAKLDRMAWAVYGNLIYHGLLPQPDLDQIEDADLLRVCQQIEYTLCGVALSIAPLLEIEEAISE